MRGIKTMNEKIKDFFRPTWAKLFVTLFFISWQYFYSFQLGFQYLRDIVPNITQYISNSLSIVAWNNYFIRTGSLFIIWILVAFIIFLALWVFEKFAVSIHNARVMRQYVNKPRKDYEHLLKKNKVKFSSHLLVNAVWVGGIIAIILSLFFISEQIEKLRVWAVDTMVWNAFESGSEVNPESPTSLIISFVGMLPVWYLVSCFNFWIFQEAKIEEEEEKEAEEHFSGIITE